MQKGIVTILDVLQVCNSEDQDEVNLNDKMAGVIAHFVAHNKAVVAMEFDSNGTLLLTADSVGNYFNLFKVGFFTITKLMFRRVCSKLLVGPNTLPNPNK